MANLTAARREAVNSLQRQVSLKLADPVVQGIFSGLGTYLLQCEQQLVALMSVPQLPPPPTGDIEFGLMLYWIEYDLPSELSFISRQFPKSTITPAIYQQWQQRWAGAGVVAPDGTLVASSTFAQLDHGWIFPSILYLLSLFGSFSTAPFGASPQTLTPTSNSLKIALIGDWGTGTWNDNGTSGPAKAIMQQVQNLNPDVVIHVGDVYYSGTGNLPSLINVLMEVLGAEVGATFDATEERDRLINAWPSGTPPVSFTLNSNHEMYSAGNGYFTTAVNTQSGTPFSHQQGTSYFAIMFQDWVILGLDSAYCSDALFYMTGRLQSPSNNAQITWIQGLQQSGKLTGKKIIVLTHHTGLTYDGCQMAPALGSTTNLYDDVYAALGRDPDYWYWGHTHNGIVYTDKVSLSPTRQTSALCRCLGHAALPFGKAYYWLAGVKYFLDQAPGGSNPKIAYYAQTALSADPPPVWQNRVKNGFALLTLSAGSITEAFYEEGNTTPVWMSAPKEKAAGV